ncbi:MAG TPA: nuclear transport factor 2 family protein [Solirubrobacteraceae bacterium]|jgi:ketosteroid isomerase-like protein
MTGPASTDLVALTRRTYDLARAGDWDALLDMYRPDIVWDMSPAGLGIYEGPAAIRAFFEEWTGSYEEYEIVPEEILDLGGGVVFVAVVQNGRPAGSSGRVQLRYGSVVVWVDGGASRITNYTDVDEARAAAERLAESTGS